MNSIIKIFAFLYLINLYQSIIVGQNKEIVSKLIKKQLDESMQQALDHNEIQFKNQNQQQQEQEQQKEDEKLQKSQIQEQIYKAMKPTNNLQLYSFDYEEIPVIQKKLTQQLERMRKTNTSSLHSLPMAKFQNQLIIQINKK